MPLSLSSELTMINIQRRGLREAFCDIWCELWCRKCCKSDVPIDDVNFDDEQERENPKSDHERDRQSRTRAVSKGWPPDLH